MKQKISILGCGWLGLPLAAQLLEIGYHVSGSTTSVSKIPKLKEKGIAPYVVDISVLSDEVAPFFMTDVLIIAITSKNVSDFKHLIQEIEKAQVKKVIFISSTSVYPNHNEVVNEATKTVDLALASIEQLFLKETSFDTTILRFGGLFGYDRQPGNFFRPGKPVGNPEGFINFIHRDDCIGVITEIIQKNIWGEIFNACAEDHPTRRAFYSQEAQKVGREDLTFDENATNEYKIVSSEKLKEMVGYRFKYGKLMEN